LHSVTDKAGEWLHDADIPEHARNVAERVWESDAATQVKLTGNGAMSSAKEAMAAHHG
jgi:hypothetical protein